MKCDRCGAEIHDCGYEFKAYTRGIVLLRLPVIRPDDPVKRLDGLIFCRRCTDNVMDYLVGFTNTEVEERT